MQNRTIADVLRDARQHFAQAQLATAGLDARLLVMAAAEVTHEQLIADPGREVSRGTLRSIEKMVARRLRREPVSRILGAREFYGRRFKLTPAVLDPRPDTELLVDVALDLAGRCRPSPRIADLGTGSGVLIITLMAELPGAVGVACDLSCEALDVARVNAQHHGVVDRISFIETDWLSGVDQPFDLIVSNPPYVEAGAIAALDPEVREFDPLLALVGGSDGLDSYRSLLPQALERLAPGGCLCLEVGAGQAGLIHKMALEYGFGDVDGISAVHQDLAGHDRVLVAFKPRFHNATW